MTTAQSPRNPGVLALVRQIIGGFARLGRLELTHGRQEIGRMLGSAKTGAIFVGIAIGFVFMALIAFVVFLVLGISALLAFLPGWLVALILFIVFAALVALFGFLAYRRLKALGPPNETIESVKEDIAWAKRLLRRE